MAAGALRRLFFSPRVSVAGGIVEKENNECCDDIGVDGSRFTVPKLLAILTFGVT